MKKFMESDHNVLRDKAVFIAIENHEEDLIDFLRESEVKILADFMMPLWNLACLARVFSRLVCIPIPVVSLINSLRLTSL